MSFRGHVCSIFILIFLLSFSSLTFAENISVIDKWSGRSLGTVESFQAGRYKFVSIKSLASVFGLNYTLNMSRKTITLDTPGDQVTVIAISPYVKIGSKILQMPVNSLYSKGDIFVPVGYFTALLSLPLGNEMVFINKDNALMVATGGENIAGVRVEGMDNGILLRISTRKEFKTGDIFTSESNGWLYVDFFGGKVDTSKTIQIEESVPSIKKIMPIQLSKDTARLAFKVATEIKEKNVYMKDANEVIVTLRTRQKLSDNVLEDLAKEQEKWKINVVVIDAGHGGRDPGAIGRSNLFEKNVTLGIAKELKAELQKNPDIKVVMTRETDIFPALKTRTQIANKNDGKLFISIHVDSNPVSTVHGHTVYFLGLAKTEEARRVAQFENSVIKLEEDQNQYQELTQATFILAANAQNSYIKESEDLAAIIDEQIRNQCESFSHGVKQAGFQVLYGASMPCILLETAFISNKYDEQKLASKSFQKSIAKAVSSGVLKFKERYESFDREH